jgi:hypothetical protein
MARTGRTESQPAGRPFGTIWDMYVSRVPAWMRRGLEAGLFAAVLSMLTVFVLPHGAASPFGIRTLPAGIDASLALALPVLAIGVFAITYPVALTATRPDAILGAIVAVVLAADLVTMLTAVIGDRVALRGGAQVLPSGLLASLLALPPATLGLAASQLFTPFGFGRRAARMAAGVSLVVALTVLLVIVPAIA